MSVIVLRDSTCVGETLGLGGGLDRGVRVHQTTGGQAARADRDTPQTFQTEWDAEKIGFQND